MQSLGRPCASYRGCAAASDYPSDGVDGSDGCSGAGGALGQTGAAFGKTGGLWAVWTVSLLIVLGQSLLGAEESNIRRRLRAKRAWLEWLLQCGPGPDHVGTAVSFFLPVGVYVLLEHLPGSLFLVLLHHLFDASWSVPVRRFLRAYPSSVWVLGVLFLPIIAFAPRVYRWMNIDPQADHALQVKSVLFNRPTFTVISIALFSIWWLVASRLRAHSLAQDQDGAASPLSPCANWPQEGSLCLRSRSRSARSTG
jgi:hypothetical protein